MAIRKIKCLDGLEIDPETCPIEELERVQALCKREEDYWNTMQLSAKTFINSVYGVFGTNFFNLANIDIAESITLQGQDLIKYSVRKVDGYFKEEWHNDIEGHKKVSDIMINEYGFKDFDREAFEQKARIPLDFKTLQVYGDSLVGDSQILTDSGMMTIKEMFDEAGDKRGDVEFKIRVYSDRKVWAATEGTPSLREIDYIMRHWTDKTIYRVTGSNGKFVDVTSDHSVMIVRNGKWMKMNPEKIVCGVDKLITINENTPDLGYILCDVESVEVSPYNGVEHFVYDICVYTDQEDEHTFFANGICVHNTDSVSADTIVRTSKHPAGIRISDFYEENSGSPVEYGDNHESVYTEDAVMNYVGENLYFAPVKRIIRHKVTKDKYRLTTDWSGKSVECTSDHSLVVYRAEGDTGQYWSHKIKPYELQENDAVVTMVDNVGYTFERANCEQIGHYEDEYVYDLEMDDFTSTFIANDILVHNSAYITMEPLFNAYGITDEQMIKFCLAVYKAVMEKYLDDRFDEYAESFHCKENLEKFELEKISRSVIMLAKKNYMCDVAWIDSGIFFDQGHHITYTGYDVVKGATTNFCREEMKKFTEFCFKKISEGRLPTQGECVQMLREAKKRFSMQSPNEIGKTVSISEYEKFVKCDNQKEIEYFDYSDGGRKTSVPIHVRATAVYNNTILYKQRKYLSKYELLKSGDKIRFYYTSPDDVFGFIPDNFPYEFAPPVDVDIQFEKSLLSPINRIIVALGLKEVPPSLTYSVSLF